MTARSRIDDLLPQFGNRLAADLTKADIVRAVDRIADRGAGIAANRTLALLRKLFNWAIAEGLVETNPAAGIPMRAKEQSRERVLDDAEIVSFWSALGRSGFDAVTADVLRLQLLLGARIREVTALHVMSSISRSPNRFALAARMGKDVESCARFRRLRFLFAAPHARGVRSITDGCKREQHMLALCEHMTIILQA